MRHLLETAHLTPGGVDIATTPGRMTVRNNDILLPQTYQELLDQDPTIDAIVCFVGPTRLKDMMSRRYSIYTDTINAMIQGMRRSRSVEVLYHSSVGTEGPPDEAIVGWPKAYLFFPRRAPVLFPWFKNVTRSERLLALSDI